MSDVQSRVVGKGPSRRRFLQEVSALTLGALGWARDTPPLAAPVAPSIPSHLPRRLSICYYGWDWITSALTDEPFGNVERALKQTKERGFNCVRAEMGLNWMFDLQGKRRGKLKFADWIPGFSDNLQDVNGKGGGEHDVFERVMQLFELAEKYDLYVITTSWEYQDSISQLADSHLRDEILTVPYNKRLMLLAVQYHRLLGELEKRGLQKRIAQVELINELNAPPLVCSPSDEDGERLSPWVEGKYPKPPCSTDRVRSLAGAAIAYIRERHPDLLVTVDGLVASSGFRTLFPENAQVADHHLYVDGITQAFWHAAGISGIRPGVPPPLEKNPFLRSMLKPNPSSWNELCRRATRVHQGWWAIAWLYENLDNTKFDKWCVENYPQCKAKVQKSLDREYQAASEFARASNLPLIVDEGFILYPPLHSRFIMTPEGHWGEEAGVNGAIATGHWGIMITGYFRPNTIGWKDDGQCEWARKLNRRILASG